MKGMALVLAALFLSVLPAGGQHNYTTKGKVTVPFEFVVGHLVLPAGDYDIMTPSPKVLVLRNISTGEVVSNTTNDAVLYTPIRRRLTLSWYFVTTGTALCCKVIMENETHAKDLYHGKDVPELATH